MVYVRLVSDEVSRENEDAEISDDEIVTWIEGRTPSEVFSILIEQGLNWELDLDEADEDEARDWALADVVARIVRANNLGKSILLDGELVGDGESEGMLAAFMRRTHFVPEIIEDNGLSLILGLEEEEGEEWKHADD